MERQPKHPFHPGEVLLEELLEPQGISQAAFAGKIGWMSDSKGKLKSLELTDMLRYLAIALSGLGMAGSAGAGDLPDPLAAGWKGESVCEKLHEDERLRILRCSFPPNVGHERHYHPPHVGYVISGGSMQVTDAGGTRTIDLPDGYIFSNPEGVDWHEALNVGDGESTYLMIEPR